MATGDTDDEVNRLQAVLPPWFPDLSAAPILNALLTGIGDAFSFIYLFLGFAKLQTRINSATGAWLDLIAWDFFGTRFMRRPNEPDDSWQPRILQEILRPRATREAMTIMLDQLTGKEPQIFEAFNTQDMGSYGTGTMGYSGGFGYGSLNYPNQIFVNAFRPIGEGIPLVAGYGTGGGGYGVGSMAYIDLGQVTGPVTDTEIQQRVVQTAAAGITTWLDIE